ncbi:MAG: hypothetical protein V7L01_06410 [Nostoc sp.]
MVEDFLDAMPTAGYAYAKILYEDTSKEKLTNLAGIEEAVQSQKQKL